MNRGFLHQTLPICLAVIATIAWFSSAGDLNPPSGAIAPTLKTLSEVEPRITINATNTPGDANSLFKITQPGSYYLTGNITGVAGKHGIEIAASGVTLDLSGFDLSGVPGMGAFSGVQADGSGRANITVINGSLRDWGHSGVQLFPAADNCRIEGVCASGNVSNGISTGKASTVTNCSAFNNGNGISTTTGAAITNCSAYNNSNHGIIAAGGSTVTNCSAFDNSGDGILTSSSGCTVSNCTAAANAGHGINAASGCSTISSCTVTSNTGEGIITNDGSTVTDCTARDNGVNGIKVFNGCTVTNCSAFSNDLNGISAGVNCTISGCTSASNTAGITTSSRCTVTGCTVNSNFGNGIAILGFDCRVTENVCSLIGNGGVGSGIYSTADNNRIEGNSVRGNDFGIFLDGLAVTGNVVVRNYARGNPSGNYVNPASGNFIGTLVGTSGGMNASTNSLININF